jgi:hypothetical protein
MKVKNLFLDLFAILWYNIYRKEKKRGRKKMFAYVTVTYLATVEPKDVGLDDNCTYEEFEEAVRERVSDEVHTNEYDDCPILDPNDIEVEVQEGKYGD